MSKLEVYDSKSGKWVDIQQYGTVEVIKHWRGDKVVSETLHWRAFSASENPKIKKDL